MINKTILHALPHRYFLAFHQTFLERGCIEQLTLVHAVGRTNMSWLNVLGYSTCPRLRRCRVHCLGNHQSAEQPRGEYYGQGEGDGFYCE